jgi:hypothetical protein
MVKSVVSAIFFGYVCYELFRIRKMKSQGALGVKPVEPESEEVDE